MKHELKRPVRLGFSLIELMIALVLGLLLLTGLYTVLGSNQLTYSAVNSSMRLTERGQQVLTLLRNQVQQAGFRNFEKVKGLENFVKNTTYGFLKGQIISGANNISGTGLQTGSDQISLRFFGAAISSATPDIADNTIFDCTGEGISESDTAAAPVVVKIYVSDDNKLMCWDSGHPNEPQVMAENVETLQFRYMPAGSNAFATADNIPATSWSNINRIEFGFLLAEPTAQGATASRTTTYQLLGESYTKDNDKLRQPFSEVLFIRNQGYTE